MTSIQNDDVVLSFEFNQFNLNLYLIIIIIQYWGTLKLNYYVLFMVGPNRYPDDDHYNGPNRIPGPEKYPSGGSYRPDYGYSYG